MKKDFIVSKIEAPQDGSHYVLVAFTDPNALKSTGGGGSGEGGTVYLSRRLNEKST
jgi:hypothetical protein